jgi:hypothetical protein
MKYLIYLVIVLTASSAYAKEIGAWRDESPGLSSTITIIKNKNTYTINTKLDSGGEVDNELKKTGNKYLRIGFSDYYIIDKDGYLNCYDDQGLIYQANPIGKLSIHTSYPTDGLSCYEIGVKFGRCATLSMKGKACAPSDDVITPERCRNNEEFKKGILIGTKSVY